MDAAGASPGSLDTEHDCCDRRGRPRDRARPRRCSRRRATTMSRQPTSTPVPDDADARGRLGCCLPGSLPARSRPLRWWIGPMSRSTIARRQAVAARRCAARRPSAHVHRRCRRPCLPGCCLPGALAHRSRPLRPAGIVRCPPRPSSRAGGWWIPSRRDRAADGTGRGWEQMAGWEWCG